jgi:hypothetical protein
MNQLFDPTTIVRECPSAICGDVTIESEVALYLGANLDKEVPGADLYLSASL